MNVLIRPESVNDPVLMPMLKHAAAGMIQTLQQNGIQLADNSVKIWIKEFGENKYFPKIEFDNNNQELQYDLTHDGEIREAHFKTFVHGKGGTKRHDIERTQADPLLVRIDSLLRH